MLGRCHRLDRRRRSPRHRPPQQDQSGGRDERRAVREGRRRTRPPHATGRYEPGTGQPCGAVVGADDRIALHGCGCGWRYREPGHRALWTGRAGERVDEPGRVDYGRDVG